MDVPVNPLAENIRKVSSLNKVVSGDVKDLSVSLVSVSVELSPESSSKISVYVLFFLLLFVVLFREEEADRPRPRVLDSDPGDNIVVWLRWRFRGKFDKSDIYSFIIHK